VALDCIGTLFCWCWLEPAAPAKAEVKKEVKAPKAPKAKKEAKPAEAAKPVEAPKAK
jgi:hypothetical protein